LTKSPDSDSGSSRGGGAGGFDGGPRSGDFLVLGSGCRARGILADRRRSALQSEPVRTSNSRWTKRPHSPVPSRGLEKWSWPWPLLRVRAQRLCMHCGQLL